MTKSSDAYWHELGVAWCAIDRDVAVVAWRLEARLRRHSRWITAGLAVGLPSGAGGVLLGAWTIGIGLSSGAWNFVARGLAIGIASAILTLALWSLRSAYAPGATTGTLSEMIDLALTRAQGTLSVIRAGLYSCLIAAVFGMVGTAIRTHFGTAPTLSPVIDLVIVALIALALVLGGRQMRSGMEKFRALKHALEMSEKV